MAERILSKTRVFIHLWLSGSGVTMSHGTIRAATLKTTIPLIMEYLNCDENEALKRFYESHIGVCFGDDSTGLYGQSAFYIASLFFREHSEGTTQPE